MQNEADSIAIYSRKSKFTGKGESIGNQVELCRAYIRNLYGVGCAERCVIFEDEGFSGGNLNRPAFQRMLADVRRAKYKAIVVYRLDRISRNISDFTGLIDELTTLGVSFLSIREQFDTGTPMGRAMMYIISVFSQLERETIAERIRVNMHQLARTGRWLGGNAPIGLRSEAVCTTTPDGKPHKAFRLIPDAEDAAIPKLIFDLYTETDSLTAVEAELLRRRIRTRRGKDYTRFAIKGILQNPVYMTADEAAYHYFREREAKICFPREAFDGTGGIMAYNRTEQEKGKTTVLLPVCQWIIAVGTHPGLIPSGQWIRAQASLERNKSAAYRKPRTNEALLTGLLFCSCGSRMYPRLSRRTAADGKPVFSYVCKMKERSKQERCRCRNIHGNALDIALTQLLQSLPEQDSRFAAQLEKHRRFFSEPRNTVDRQLANLRAEHAQAETCLNGLIDRLGLVRDSLAEACVLKRIGDLSETCRNTERRIRELEASASAVGFCEPDLDRLQQELSVFPLSVDRMSVTEKRDALCAVVKTVIWDGTHAHVTLSGSDTTAHHWREDSK